MSITFNGTTLGCPDQIEDQADALAHAGDDIRTRLERKQSLPLNYVANGVEYNVVGDGGAAGDGSTDDTAALSRAFGAERSGIPTIVVLDPGKTYRYSTSDLALSAGTHVLGYRAIMVPLSVDNTRISLQSGCSILGVHLFGVQDSYSRRRERFDKNRAALGAMYGKAASNADTSNAAAWIDINGKSNCILTDVHSRGSLVGLVRAKSITNCMFERISAYRTHAAAVLLEDECRFCTIRQVDVTGSGDSALAIIQGARAAGQPRDLLVENVRGKYIMGGAGLSVVGARNVLIRRGWFEDCALAGLRIGPEDGQSAANTSAIDVVDTEAWRCAKLKADPKENGLFAALVSSKSHTCTDIAFSGCFGAAYKDRYGGGNRNNLVRTTNGGAGVPVYTATNCDTEELVPGD